MYDFSYWANIPRAIKNKSVIVKVSAYATNPIVSTSMFENAKSSRQVIKGLKQYDARLKNLVKSSRENPLAVKYSDISSGINNSIAKKIEKNPENADKYLGLKRQIIALPVSKISGQELDKSSNLIVPKTGPSTKQDRSIRRAAIKSILSSGVDPSAIGEASFPLNNYWSSIQGLNRKYTTRNSYHNRRQRLKNSRWKMPSRRSLTQSRQNDEIKRSVWGSYIRKRMREAAYRDARSLSFAPTKTQVTTKTASFSPI